MVGNPKEAADILGDPMLKPPRGVKGVAQKIPFGPCIFWPVVNALVAKFPGLGGGI